MDYRDDFSSPQGGVVVLQTGDRRVTEYDLGDGRILRKTECLVDEELLEANKQSYNDSDGKRWGDGRVAASIPMNVFYNKLAPAIKQEDRAYLKKWLNDSDNRMYRTFKGNV